MSELVRLSLREADVEEIQADWGRRRPFAQNLSDFLAHLIGGTAPTEPSADGPLLTDHDPDRPPALRHSRIISLELAGARYGKLTWQELFEICISAGAGRGLQVEELSRLFRTRLRRGRSGRRHYAEGSDLSYSGMNADSSYRALHALAVRIGAPFDLRLTLTAEPGRTHRLRLTEPGPSGPLFRS